MTDLEQIEGLRRSIAVLPANSYDRILSREEALRLIGALQDALRAIPLQGGT